MNTKRSPFDLHGHRALVTGGTQGVGAAIATSLAQAGADILIVGLHADQNANETLAKCRDHGVNAEMLTTDLSVPPGQYMERFTREADLKLPGVDLLVNNAGTFNETSFLEMDFERYLATMHLNVTAGYFLTQTFARRWIGEGVAGRVLFTGSINGILAEPGHTAYDTSKGAVAAMVRSLCVALAPSGIRVNAIAPGLVKTPLTQGVLAEGSALEQWMKLHTPNGEVPAAEVCGEAAVFLLSDAATHIHGQTLLIDGGMSIWQQPDPPGS